MGVYVPFNELTTIQKEQAIGLRLKWPKAEFLRFQFWVKDDGQISRRAGHHTLTVEEGAKIDAMLRDDVRTRGDLRDFKTADFSITHD